VAGKKVEEPQGLAKGQLDPPGTKEHLGENPYQGGEWTPPAQEEASGKK
jgi:hypothetical protein